MRKLFVGGLAALAVTGGSVAVAVVDPMGLAGAAQEDDTPSEAPDAGDSGEPELRGPHGGLLHEALDGLVDDGVLTEEQADAVVERLRELARDKRSERFWGHWGLLDDVEELLELTPEEIRERLREGETLADIAGERVDELVERLVEEARERIDEAVEEGRFDADRAEDLLGRIEDGIRDFVDGDWLERWRHHWPRHGGPGWDRPGFGWGPGPEPTD